MLISEQKTNMLPWTPLTVVVLKNLYHDIENRFLYAYDGTSYWMKQKFKNIAEEQKHELDTTDKDKEDTNDKADAIDVIFGDEVFPTFTVKLITNEEQNDKETIKCHCSEQSFVGASEVQEWKVELDDSSSEADESDTTDRRSITSPGSMTDHHVLLLSPQVPPNDSVTLYSLSETDNIEVSYTFHLTPTKN